MESQSNDVGYCLYEGLNRTRYATQLIVQKSEQNYVQFSEINNILVTI